MYAPQVESWDGQKHMIFRAAVSYTYKESQKPDLDGGWSDLQPPEGSGERATQASERTKPALRGWAG